MQTAHAQRRAQQRSIPAMVDQLLDQFGEEMHDGHGAVIVYLSKASIRNMERELGRRPVSKLSEWHDAYKVRSTSGLTLTVGHRDRRIWRR